MRMGWFGGYESDKVTIAGEKLTITFPPKPNGKRRDLNSDDLIHIVTVRDNAAHCDKIFQLYEPGIGMVDSEVNKAIGLSKRHGIPVIMNVMGKGLIADRHDTVDAVMQSYRGTKERDMQSTLSAYTERLEARDRSLKAAAALSAVEEVPGEQAGNVDKRREMNQDGPQIT